MDAVACGVIDFTFRQPSQHDHFMHTHHPSDFRRSVEPPAFLVSQPQERRSPDSYVGGIRQSPFSFLGTTDFRCRLVAPRPIRNFRASCQYLKALYAKTIEYMTNQRRSPRSSFVVTAEITNENSRTVIARLRNLNLHGCYIEMSNPLPEQSALTIKVTAGTTVFEAHGRVVYSGPNTGSGVEFQRVEPRYQAILEEWLLEAQDINKVDE